MAQMECVYVYALTVGKSHTALTFEIDSIGRFKCVNGTVGLVNIISLNVYVWCFYTEFIPHLFELHLLKTIRNETI